MGGERKYYLKRVRSAYWPLALAVTDDRDNILWHCTSYSSALAAIKTLKRIGEIDMDTREHLGSTLLNSAAFSNGEEKILTIARVGLFVDAQNRKKIRLGFSDGERDLILNQRSRDAIEAKMGCETDKWYGWRLKLKTQKVKWQDNKTKLITMVDSIFIVGIGKPLEDSRPVGEELAGSIGTENVPLVEDF